MIFSIDKLENLGIYSNIPPKKANDFKRYNLIYGWNGSGKSTLSRLFGFLGGRELPKEFDGLKVTVTVDGVEYSEKQLPLTYESIAVFNEDFIKDNIDWNGTLNSILLLDEGNIEVVKTYTTLKEELYGKDGNIGLIHKLEEKEESLKKTYSDMQKILTNIGKNVKNNYQLLDTRDTYYLNYDKRKVAILLNEKTKPLSDADILKPEELDRAIKQAKPIKRDNIEIAIKLIDIDFLKELVKETKEVVKRKVASKVLDELRDNPPLATWVEKGLEIHKNEGKTVCAFCGGNISNERFTDLESHFSNALNMLKKNIETGIEKWMSYKSEIQATFANTTIYYDELVSDIKGYNEKYNLISIEMNNEIDKYIQLLDNKKNTPFDVIKSEIVDEKIIEYAGNINELLKKYETTIASHNKKTATFDETTKAIKKRIERHYVQEQIKALTYNDKKKAYEQDEEDMRLKSIEKDRKLREYNKLENELSNETLGAEEFNNKLEKFLGYGEIKLEFDAQQKGYKIYRNTHEEANNLSEGEKTAIAFIYFIIKLKENGRKMEDYILVIDDPISSFDSNKIFSSYAYMKSECENAKQIFILTHNYNYFSLVLGWFCKRYIKDADTNKKLPAYALYRIENKIENSKRIAILCDGGESMKQATEYDYVFYTVYSMKDASLSKQESIFCGNVCRKLVESFLSFKFPKQRADLMALLQAALPGKENDITRERIYKFVNIYSHEKKINVFEELDTDILDANSQMVVNDILKMIKELDKNHYNAMVDKVQNEL